MRDGSSLVKVVEISKPGGPEVLKLSEHPDPVPVDDEIRIRVVAAGVNRPDILQRKGLYLPPPGASLVPGLEVAGEVDAVGVACTRFRVGDRVAALLSGGGYAELCVVPEEQCLPIPEGVSFLEAAAVPETWFTVWANVFELGALTEGETLLVHGGSSGIGHAAIQLAKARGARVITTSGRDDKAAFCRSLGVDTAINYRTEDFVVRCKDVTGARGVDVVLDMVGGDYLPRNLDVLGFRGRHVSIAFLRGMRAELPIHKIMAKQIYLTGSYLRSRSLEEKGRLRLMVQEELWPLLADGRAKPHIYDTWDLGDASTAHQVMEEGHFLGKLVLKA